MATALKIAFVSFCFIITGAALFNCGPQIPTTDGSDVVVQDAADSGNPDTIVQPDGSDANGDDHVVIPVDGSDATDGGALICSPSTTQPRPVCTTGMVCQCVPEEDWQLGSYCQTSTDAMDHCRAAMACDAVTGVNRCSPHLPVGIDGSTPFTCQDELQFGVWVVAEDAQFRDTRPTSYEQNANGLLRVDWSLYIAAGGPTMVCLDKHCYTNRGVADFISSSVLAFSSNCREIQVQNYDPGGAPAGLPHIVNWVRRSF